MQIVMISGKQGSGKTTISDALAARLGGAAIRLRFAQPLYEMHNAVLSILAAYGMARPGLVKDGPLLQILGTEWGRNTIDPDIWVRCIQNKVAEIGKKFQEAVVIVDDMRFRNEFDAFSALKIRLECPREIRKARCSTWRDNENHQSEIDLDEYSDSWLFNLYLETEQMPVQLCVDHIVRNIGKPTDIAKSKIVLDPKRPANDRSKA
jgi:phosphomevalonate kinase